MDILQDILVFDGGSRSKNVEFKDLLINPKDLWDFNSYQIGIIYNIVSKCGKKINGLKTDNCDLKESAKSAIRRKVKENAIKQLKKYNINTATVLNILRRCFKVTQDEYGFSKYSLICLNLLFLSNKLEVLKCFRDKYVSDDVILVEVPKDKYWDYNLFGHYYKKNILNSYKFKDL